jgi:hypothetical protein
MMIMIVTLLWTLCALMSALMIGLSEHNDLAILYWVVLCLICIGLACYSLSDWPERTVRQSDIDGRLAELRAERLTAATNKYFQHSHHEKHHHRQREREIEDAFRAYPPSNN